MAAIHLTLPPKKQKYDCIIEYDYVYVGGESRPLTPFVVLTTTL